MLGFEIISSNKKNIFMDSIIKESLQKGITFPEYKEMVSQLLQDGKSTGPSQSEEIFEYSKLNYKRMSRLDKTLKIDAVSQAFISDISRSQTWVLITESWCGDAAQTIPMIDKIANLSEKINLQVVLRDENEALMNKFLTNGNKAIPKLIVLDSKTNTVLGDWGPRPSKATKIVSDYKAKHGALDAQFKQDLQQWYNKDKGIDTLNDILELVKEFDTEILEKSTKEHDSYSSNPK